MSEPKVISVILNTNRRVDTLECLESLGRNGYQNHRTILLDNASTDGSKEAVRASFPAVQIIELTENHGYAGNNNVGIEAALAQGADWVFVLNEDTVLDPDCLARLVAVGQSNERIGIVGPMVYHHDEPHIIQSAGGLFGRYWQGTHICQNQHDVGQLTKPHPVDWISGCALMVRTPAITQVGMLDARFFYYREEFEWCFRIRNAGWRIMHVPAARVWHKGVQRDYHPQPSLTYYDTRNRLLMLSKHRAPLGAWVVAWVTILRTMTSWTLRRKWKPMRKHRDAMWRAALDFFHGNWGQMRP